MSTSEKVKIMSQETENKTNNSVVQELVSAISSLRFGSIEITVHEGRVTQIEKREKVRFTDSNNASIKPTEKTAAKTLKVSSWSDAWTLRKK